jgi:formylglycine-generating enzyme required for sulfatase activity/tRNA A-37 threonylcarbamoyl transferase component Bud32
MPLPSVLPADFGRYRLLEKLGEGGMGAVYKARDARLGRVVALKVIRRELLAHPDAARRFLREVRAAAQLSHPNVVHALDAGEAGGTHFLALEFVEGADLATLVRQRGPLPVELARDCVRQAALGLQHAFERGLVHRDVKPSNLLLTRDGQVKVLDLGLARRHQADEGEASTTLTREGAVMGTLDYIAPEQALDAHSADIRADLYSLGCTLYFLLTGRVPFPGGSATEKLLKHQLEEPEPVERLRPGLPPAVAAVVRNLMAKRPEDRYRTPAELAAALAGTVGDVPAAGEPARSPDPGADTAPHWSALEEAGPALPGGARPRRAPEDSPWRRGRRWAVAGAAGLLVVAVLVAAVLVRGYWAGPAGPNGPRGTTVPEAPRPLVAPFSGTTARESQQAWAAYLGLSVEETLELGGGEQLVVVLIPPGTFRMGSPPDEPQRIPAEKDFDVEAAHRVTLTKPFYLGKYPVTQAQYEAIMGRDKNKSWFRPQGGGAEKVKGMPTDHFPVDNVSWKDADTFCAALAKKVGKKVALPSEAQWEWACRAGTATPFHFGKEGNGTQANYKGTQPYGTDQAGPYLQRTSEVGSYPPNAWGLYDVHGNVWQWCRDWYGPYAGLPATDPERTDPGPANLRVLRGGSWATNPWNCRAATRSGCAPSFSDYSAGFRVAVRLE